MLWRIAFLLTPVVLLAVVTFNLLVQADVERVVAIHVTDKATHLLDMLLEEADTLDELNAAGSSSAFIGMAVSSHVASIYLFGPDGLPLGENDTASPLPLGQDDPAHMGHAHDGHLHATPVEQMRVAEIVKVEPPSPQVLQPLIDGGRDPVFSTGQVVSDDGQIGVFGRVSLPAYTGANELIGIVSFTISASHIYAGMVQGSGTFGIMFTLFGAVLFGIPALAFWVQKRLAERSARDVGYLSRHDALTDLLNRQTFSTEIETLFANERISHVGYIDADRFKLINDTYGHSVGDAFLQHIADLTRRILGENALVARFGGDEFIFALDRRDAAVSMRKVDQLRRYAAKEIYIDGFSITSSISIGIADFRTGDTPADALQRADAALYFAKSQGRNQVAVYVDEMGEGARKRQKLEALLRDACASGGFELAFQPLVNARSTATDGFEALLRLQDEDGAIIPPSDFIPLAEEIGLIEEIGKWVLFNAMQQISAFDDVSGVSINLSAEQFKSQNLIGYVKDAMIQSGLPAHRVELEITESVLLQHEEHVENQIEALKNMGISIAMDDFGTGFSSLSTLWRYGFDRIKIDKSFVHALEKAPEKSQQLIDSIILLGERMGMSITAEGIETQDQSELLRDLGCDVLQGYYFGKPLPLDHYAALAQNPPTFGLTAS